MPYSELFAGCCGGDSELKIRDISDILAEVFFSFVGRCGGDSELKIRDIRDILVEVFFSCSTTLYLLCFISFRNSFASSSLISFLYLYILNIFYKFLAFSLLLFLQFFRCKTPAILS
jgi:hypothetical protein